jgi:hypothetical protein
MNRACLEGLSRRCFKVHASQQCRKWLPSNPQLLHPWSRETTLRETKQAPIIDIQPFTCRSYDSVGCHARCWAMWSREGHLQDRFHEPQAGYDLAPIGVLVGDMKFRVLMNLYLSILNSWSHFSSHAVYPPHQAYLSNHSLTCVIKFPPQLNKYYFLNSCPESSFDVSLS